MIGRKKCLFVTVLGTASPVLALCISSNLWFFAAAASFSGEGGFKLHAPCLGLSLFVSRCLPLFVRPSLCSFLSVFLSVSRSVRACSEY